MITVVTAVNKVDLDPVTLGRVMQNVEGSLYTTYEVYDNFKPAAINRPKTFILNQLEMGVVDKVIQIGYNGSKSPIVTTAEELGVDVILYRSMV